MTRIVRISDGSLHDEASPPRIPLGSAAATELVFAPESDAAVPPFATPLADDPRHSVLEQQLAQTHRLACLARGMAGIGHDLRNVLTGIGLLSELLASELADSPVSKHVTEMAHAVRCALDLVHQLLSLAKPDGDAAQALSLNALLRGMSALLENIAGSSIALDMRCGPTPALVKIAPAHVYQIVLNLVFNARDAMPSGGILALETSETHFPQADALRWGLPAGDYVNLVVRDTGCGMDAITRARACEPFFTTKAERGTGLGLAMVRRIVTDNRGALSIQSRPGKGTAVTILLPQCGKARVSRRKKNVPAGRKRTGLVQSKKS